MSYVGTCRHMSPVIVLPSYDYLVGVMQGELVSFDNLSSLSTESGSTELDNLSGLKCSSNPRWRFRCVGVVGVSILTLCNKGIEGGLSRDGVSRSLLLICEFILAISGVRNTCRNFIKPGVSLPEVGVFIRPSRLALSGIIGIEGLSTPSPSVTRPCKYSIHLANMNSKCVNIILHLKKSV